MQCEMMGELISGYIDGVLDGESRELVERHLASCSECRRSHESLLAVCSLSGKAEVELPADLRAGILQKIAAAAACASVEELLPLAADGSLGDDDARTVSAHTAACSSCARELDSYRHLLAAAQAAAHNTAPVDLRDRIARRTYARAPFSLRGLSSLRPVLRGAVAASVAVLAAAALWMGHGVSSVAPGPQASVGHPEASRVAGRTIPEPIHRAPSNKVAALAPIRVPATAMALPRWQPVHIRLGHGNKTSALGKVASLPLPPIKAGQGSGVTRPSQPLPEVASSGDDSAASPPAASTAVQRPERIQIVKASPDDILKRESGEDLTAQMRETILLRRSRMSGGAGVDSRAVPSVSVRFWETRF